MEAVVDIQGFRGNFNKFIVKEFAVVSENFKAQVVFQAPYDFNTLRFPNRGTARWLTERFHYMRWDEPGMPYDEEFIRNLCSQFSVLHVRGLEKWQFLCKFHNKVYCIDFKASEREFDDKQRVECILPQHNCYRKNYKCALNVASVYYRNMFPLVKNTSAN